MAEWLWNCAANKLDKTLGQSALDELLQLLSFSNSNFDYDPFWKLINDLLAVMTPFGFAMITTWFLIHMFDIAAKDQVTIDSIIKVLIQLIMAVALVGNLELIVNSFLSITETMFASMTGAEDNPTLSGAEIVEIWKAVEPGGYFSVYIDVFWIGLLKSIATLAVNFAALSRILEIGWKTVFAPIGCSNVFDGGVNSPGVKYLKGLFATIISAVALYVIVATGFSLSASFLIAGEEIVSSAQDIIPSSGSLSADQVEECATYVKQIESSLLTSMAAMLATAGAAIGVSNKIKEVIG